MLGTIFWKMRYGARRLWVRTVLISFMSLVIAGISPILSGILPAGLRGAIDGEALNGLLDIVTSSMLAVATFSLSIMVTAHLSADKGVTPRSHRLLQEDSRTQTVIATFIGAFIYALTLRVLHTVGFIASGDTAVAYFATVVVIVLIAVAMLRWVAHLDGLGSVEATSRRVEERTSSCIAEDRKRPYLGARALTDPGRQIPDGVHIVHAEAFGYVQNIDVEALSGLAESWAARIYMRVVPGDWINGGDVLACVECDDFDLDREGRVQAAVTVGDVRLWDQDSAFGMIVLAEIAERALSPGINDPRTSLDIVTRLTRLMFEIPKERELDEPRAEAVFVPPKDLPRMMEQTFDRIARDGRTFVEVQLQLQRAYAKLMRHPSQDVRDAIPDLSRRAMAYAKDGLLLEADLSRVRDLAVSPVPAARNDADAKESEAEALGEEQEESYDRGA